MKTKCKNYWRREDGFAGITLATAAAVAGIAGAAVGVGATAYGLSKGTPGSQPAAVGALYGSGAKGSNAGNYANGFGPEPGQLINQWEHQDITLPDNPYGSIPENNSVYGEVAMNGGNTSIAQVGPVASPLATAPASAVSVIPSTSTFAGISVSTLELIALAGGVMALGMALIAHHHKK